MLLFQGYYPSNSRLDGIHHWGTGRVIERDMGIDRIYNQVWTQKTLVTRVAGTLGLQLQLTAQVQMLKLCKSFGHILPQVCGDAVAVVRCLLIAPCTTDRSILQSTSEILDTQVWRGKIYGEKLSTDTVGWFRNPKANHRLDVTYKTLVNNGDKLPSPQLVIAWDFWTINRYVPCQSTRWGKWKPRVKSPKHLRCYLP